MFGLGGCSLAIMAGTVQASESVLKNSPKRARAVCSESLQGSLRLHLAGFAAITVQLIWTAAVVGWSPEKPSHESAYI